MVRAEVISSRRGFIPARPGGAGQGFAGGREAPLTGAARSGCPWARREEVTGLAPPPDLRSGAGVRGRSPGRQRPVCLTHLPCCVGSCGVFSVTDLGHDLLAAIGEVVVEATALEHALALLVVTRCGWTEDRVRALTAFPGAVRKAVNQVAVADYKWMSFRRLRRDTFAVLDDRSALVHALVVEATSDDLPALSVELWHARSGTTAAQPTAADVKEHAFDIQRCFVRTVQLIDEAKDRYQANGSLPAVRMPKPLDWQVDRAES